MSRIAQVYLSDQDERRLETIARELGRTESDLLDSAVADAISTYWWNGRRKETNEMRS